MSFCSGSNVCWCYLWYRSPSFPSMSYHLGFWHGPLYLHSTCMGAYDWQDQWLLLPDFQLDYRSLLRSRSFLYWSSFWENLFSNAAANFLLAKLIGCLFHIKQAGHCKMKNLGFPDKEVAFAIRWGIYDLLTIIPVEHLTAVVEFVMDIIFVHLCELYDDDSMHEKAVSRRTCLWSTYF